MARSVMSEFATGNHRVGQVRVHVDYKSSIMLVAAAYLKKSNETELLKANSNTPACVGLQPLSRMSETTRDVSHNHLRWQTVLSGANAWADLPQVARYLSASNVCEALKRSQDTYMRTQYMITVA